MEEKSMCSDILYSKITDLKLLLLFACICKHIRKVMRTNITSVQNNSGPKWWLCSRRCNNEFSLVNGKYSLGKPFLGKGGECGQAVLNYHPDDVSILFSLSLISFTSNKDLSALECNSCTLSHFSLLSQQAKVIHCIFIGYFWRNSCSSTVPEHLFLQSTNSIFVFGDGFWKCLVDLSVNFAISIECVGAPLWFIMVLVRLSWEIILLPIVQEVLFEQSFFQKTLQMIIQITVILYHHFCCCSFVNNNRLLVRLNNKSCMLKKTSLRSTCWNFNSEEKMT